MSIERKKIIVVDDNLEDLTALKNTMKDIYDVYPCPSVLKMFDLLEHIQPDLILLDVEMPDMNGYEAMNKLKSSDKYHEIPVIFLTCMDDAQSEMEGLKLGALDYIHKPFVTPLLLQRIKMHIALIDHRLEAQNASRSKGEFLSHMSHEIRTPLSAVIGMINIAAGTEDIQKIKHCLDRAGSASKHLLNIINNILDMSKIEANKLELSYSEFDFKKMLAGIFDVIGVRAEEKHQHITVNVNENIPQFLIGDELRLSQVITNLLTNAIKFTPEKGAVALCVEMTEDAGNEVTIRAEIADSGIGITEEQQKRLFTSYNQADSSISKNFGGTGLGLVISKQIVELMQGKIWIESEINKGSKFIFTIKAKKGTDNAVKNTSLKSNDSKYAGFNFREYTILAAEDVEINREILAALLEETGISIDFTDNGTSAVSMFKTNPDKYNLILMDIQMPEMDGYEAARAIRAVEGDLRKQIPIIAMTANVFHEDIEKCLSAGMNDHIGKPINAEDLYETLKKHLLP
jgi:two-component system, sensor histidine kinase and response regulator